MTNNKNADKINELSEKIAHKEGLRVEEIEQDISKQMGHAPTVKSPDLSHRVAHQGGVRVGEINRDLTEQMGRADKEPVKTSGSNLWVYIAVIAAFALAAWWIFSKYF